MKYLGGASNIKFHEMTVKDLKAHAKTLGLKRYSALRRDALINLIDEHSKTLPSKRVKIRVVGQSSVPPSFDQSKYLPLDDENPPVNRVKRRIKKSMLAAAAAADAKPAAKSAAVKKSPPVSKSAARAKKLDDETEQLKQYAAYLQQSKHNPHAVMPANFDIKSLYAGEDIIIKHTPAEIEKAKGVIKDLIKSGHHKEAEQYREIFGL